MNPLFEYLLNHAIMTAIIFGVGSLIRRFVGAKSEARRKHGRYVFWWMIGSFGIGGIIGSFVGDIPLGAAGVANFCLLCGWVIGMIHGGLMMFHPPPNY